MSWITKEEYLELMSLNYTDEMTSPIRRLHQCVHRFDDVKSMDENTDIDDGMATETTVSGRSQTIRFGAWTARVGGEGLFDLSFEFLMDRQNLTL